MENIVLLSLRSFLPSWSTNNFDLGDHSLSLYEITSVFVLEDTKTNAAKHSLILVVPLVVTDRFLECSLFHDLLSKMKDTYRR